MSQQMLLRVLMQLLVFVRYIHSEDIERVGPVL